MTIHYFLNSIIEAKGIEFLSRGRLKNKTVKNDKSSITKGTLPVDANYESFGSWFENELCNY